MVARWTSLALGLPQTAIRVIAKDVGGAFGLKNHPWRRRSSVILAALLLRPAAEMDRGSARESDRRQPGARAGDDPAHRLRRRRQAARLARRLQLQQRRLSAGARTATSRCICSCGPPTRCRSTAFCTRGWYSNTVGLAAYRGPWAMESLIRETALDVAARQIGIDPIEIRRRNLVTLATSRRTSCMRHSARGHHARPNASTSCSRRLRRRRLPRRAGGGAQGGALSRAWASRPMSSRPAPPAASATMTGELAQVRIEPTGKVTATMSTHSQGHGTATTMAQIIADRLGVAYEDVTVFEGDSSRGGFCSRRGRQPPGRDRGRRRDQGLRTAGRQGEARSPPICSTPTAERIRIENGMVHVAGRRGNDAHAALDRRDRLWRARPPAARLRGRAGGAIPLHSRRR